MQLSELVASQEAEVKHSQICVVERKLLMNNLKASLENNYRTNSSKLQNFTDFWQSIQDTVIEVQFFPYSFIVKFCHSLRCKLCKRYAWITRKRYCRYFYSFRLRVATGKGCSSYCQWKYSFSGTPCYIPLGYTQRSVTEIW